MEIAMPEVTEHGYFDITAELLTSIVQGLQPGVIPRRFIVVSDAIPKDAAVLRVESIDGRDVRVVLSGCEPRMYVPKLSVDFEAEGCK